MPFTAYMEQEEAKHLRKSVKEPERPILENLTKNVEEEEKDSSMINEEKSEDLFKVEANVRYQTLTEE